MRKLLYGIIAIGTCVLILYACSKKSDVAAPAPNATSISGFSPTTATTNATVTITGNNFTGATAVTFGGTPASSFTVVNATTITAVVGTGSSGDVKVTAPAGVATSSGFTFVSPYAACKLTEQSGRADVGAGIPRSGFRAPTTGNVKVSVIFVDFSDAPAGRTPQDVFSLISPASENYLAAVSYNNLTLTFEPNYKWFRMSKPSSAYGWSSLTFDAHKAYIQEAIGLADPTVDFSKSDAFLIVSNPDAGSLTNGPAFCASPGGFTIDGKLFNNGVTSGRDLLVYKGLWFPHEFGHNMGLADLYAFGTGVLHRFMGSFSMMGDILGKAPEYSAWERWQLGWLNDNQVVCFNNTGSSTVTLSPVEVKNTAVKLLVIPINGNSAVVVESRKATGYDSLMPKQGPMVYLIDTKVQTGQGPIRVLPVNDADGNKLQAPMSVGQTITYGTISIKFVSTDASGDVIQYEKK
jgi:M6 family metalloprotease-like protein